MIKQYKINEEQYFPLRKKIGLDIILFIILFIITPIAIGVYNHQTDPAIWFILFIPLGPVVLSLVPDYFLSTKNKRTLLNDYSITFADNTITQKIPVPKSSLINSQPVPEVNKIPYENITEIKKTGNDSFIIIAKHRDHLNLIAIPSHIKNYDSLEIELEKIHPITKSDSIDTEEQSFTIPKNGFKEFQSYFLSRLIPAFAIMLLLLTALIYPDDNTGWRIWGTILCFTISIMFWGFSKMLNKFKSKYNSYRLTIDKQLVIEEQKGLITIIPINEIIEIKKSSEHIVSITGNGGMTDKRFWHTIIIPAQIENKQALERRLDSIVPIIKVDFLGRKTKRAVLK